MSSTRNIEVGERLPAALFAGDQATILDMVDADFILRPPHGAAYFGRYEGRDGLSRLMEKFTTVYDIQTAEKTRTFTSDDPDEMIFEFAIKGVVRATGKPFDSTVLEVWHFRDGRLREIRPHWFELPG
jgi:ketosteroid isomerase-like protein